MAGPGPTYVDRILELFAAHPEREAVVCGDRRTSYAQAREQVLRTANALQALGLRRGDVVALYLGNHPDLPTVELAVHLLGCRMVFVPGEPGLGEVLGYLRRAEPVALVIEPAVERSAELARHADLDLVLTLGPGDVGTDLLALAAAQPATEPAVRAGVDEISTVFYTGGSTGRPKLVLHRHGFYAGLVNAAARRRAESPTPQRFLVCTLITHSSGHIACLMTLLAGGTVVLQDGFDAKAVIAALTDEVITSTLLMPPMLYALLDSPDLPPGGFPHLGRLHYGGAPTAPVRLAEAIERFGPIMRQAYGLTEIPNVTLMEPADHDLAVPGRLASSGRPLPGWVEISVRDEAGVEVPTGEVGEVWARSPAVMTEYWRDPEATATAVRDGWLRTGDLGRRDSAGFLYLVDRARDMIVTGLTSANAYSHLLEGVLARHPGVRAVAVVGLPDEEWGEGIHVACVPHPDVRVDAEELRALALAELGPLYEPRSVTFLDALPWTTVGKVDKKAVRAMLLDRAR
jgi:fatty-acyl-CoA synthase